MKRKVVKCLILLGVLFCFSDCLWVMASNENLVHIHFFHSDTCVHCQEEMKTLQQIEKKYSNVVIYYYEVHDEENAKVLEQIKETYHITTNGVPITIIGDQVYVGFQQDKSAMQFTKTILYYSHYPYQDRVIHSNVGSIIDEHENIPTLKEYMKVNYNYQLLGMNTNDLDVSVIAVILGGLSQINFIFLLSIIVVFIIFSKVNDIKNKLLLLIFYFFNSILVRLGSVLDYYYVTLGMRIFMLILFGIICFKFYQNREKQYVIMNVLIILSLVEEYFYLRIYGKYLVMLKNISDIHLLLGVEKVSYYVDYFFSMIMIDTLLILFVQKKLTKN